MGPRVDGADLQRGLALEDAPQPRYLLLQQLLLRRTQRSKGLHAYQGALALRLALPEAARNAVDEQNRHLADAAAKDHAVGPLRRDRLAARMAANEVAVEMRQQANAIGRAGLGKSARLECERLRAVGQ